MINADPVLRPMNQDDAASQHIITEYQERNGRKSLDIVGFRKLLPWSYVGWL